MRNTGYRILAGGVRISNDTWETGINNNDVIIGPPGSGKTRGYVIPNILQCGGSMIIADSKGAVCQQVSGVLEQNGYKICELNLADCWKSTAGYNPLKFIRFDYEHEHYSEQDILRVSACLVPQEIANEPFWDHAARMLLETLMGYLLECQPEEEHTLDNVVLLLSQLGSATNKLLDEYAAIAPNSFPARRWMLYKSMTQADRTQACIQGILAEKLSTLSFDGVSELYYRDNQIDFASLGRERTALFLTISDTDRSLDTLAALLYTQALQELCAEADGNPNHRLNIPVRLYLDDFACNAVIPDFDKIISVIRSREISVSIILQSISQLESLYGHPRALTIINGCDSLLYLGGQDVETAQFVGVKANKPTSAILNMSLDDAWLFTRGTTPRQVRKYTLSDHPRYRELSECQVRQNEMYFCDEYDEDLPF